MTQVERAEFLRGNRGVTFGTIREYVERIESMDTKNITRARAKTSTLMNALKRSINPSIVLMAKNLEYINDEARIKPTAFNLILTSSLEEAYQYQLLRRTGPGTQAIGEKQWLVLKYAAQRIVKNQGIR